MNLRARLLMFAIVVSVVGCRTEGDRSVAAVPEPAPEAVAEAAVWQEPAPEPPAVDRSLGRGLELRRPIVDGRLTLVPIVATRATPQVRYITLGEGLATGEVEVTELGALVVDTLRVRNRSALPLFVLQGELLLGGMQDRVASRSMVILARTTAALAVRCVEKGRSEGEPAFHAGRAIVELALRRTIAHEDQNDVWRHIDALLERRAAMTMTNAYLPALAVLADGDGTPRVDRILAQLTRREEHANVVGFAVAIDGELVALDRFATPALLAAFERQLLASYAADTSGSAPAPPPLDPAAIRRFAAGAATTPASTIVLTARSNEERRATQPPPSEEDDG